MKEYDSYKEFLKSGGITATGGEPLAQPEFLAELFALAKSKGVHTCLDTSAGVYDPARHEKIDEALKYTDLVMLDIKHIDNEEHRKLTGKGNRNILAFAEHIRELGIPVWIRHVLVPGITDDDEALHKTRGFIETLQNIERVEVLPYHSMGAYKWKELGVRYTLEDTQPPAADRVKNAEMILNGLK